MRRKDRSALSMPAAVQRSTIWPSRQRVTLRLVVRAIEITDSTGFDVVNVLASRPSMPSRATVNICSIPLRSVDVADDQFGALFNEQAGAGSAHADGAPVMTATCPSTVTSWSGLSARSRVDLSHFRYHMVAEPVGETHRIGIVGRRHDVDQV